MERSTTIGRRLTLPLVGDRLDVGAAGSWTAAFAIVVYLAASGGGYDPIVHSEAGIALWWVVLAGAASGVLPLRFGRLGWAALALLAAFSAWTALGMTWTESAERTGAELARVTTFLGVLAVGLLAVGGRSPRPLLNGLGCAFAAVAGLAVLSRLQPAWFPANDHAQFLPEAINRLSYPLNSWNGLASFLAIGLPVVAATALGARSRLGQAAAAAALPLIGLGIFLTASRGGAIAAGVGVVLILVLFGDRLAAAATLATSGAGAAILIAAAAQRDELERGIPSAIARSEGSELLVLALIVCLGVALMQVAIGLAARFERRPRWMTPSPRRTAALGCALVALAAAGALAAGAGTAVSDAWTEFKATPSELGPTGAPATESTARDVADRLSTVSGNGRWQYWQSTVAAMESDPLTGTGPGTFEYWWARNGTIPGFVRDAHSLYFETLGETGLVGFALLVALLLAAIAGGAVRTARAVGADRLPIAAATAAIAVFAVTAAVDWVWELAVVPCALMLLIAVAVGGARGTAASALPGRAVLSLAAILALVAIAVPLAGVSAVRASQTEAGRGDLPSALAAAGSAERVQPYAATPPLQRALVLELAGDYGAAVTAARQATAEEPTNWRTWLVRSRLEARAGRARDAVASFRRARSLNPRSPTLAR